MANTSILEVDGLVCGYDEPLLGPLDLSFPEGAFVLIEGPNGIGKSTLVETLVELVEPLDGRFEWAVEASELRFVPQVRTLDPVLPATVADVLALGGDREGSWLGWRESVDGEAVDRRLDDVEMRPYRDALFRDLSEGQKQLVLLARALLGEPRALLLDEPTASMDPERESRAADLLREFRDRTDAAVFAIAHGSRAFERAATHSLEIDRNREVSVVESNAEGAS